MSNLGGGTSVPQSMGGVKTPLPKGYKQTEIGVIPEEWEVVQLEDIAIFKNGKGHEQFIDEKGKFVVINSKFISTDGEVYKSSNENLSPLNIGDITMVMSDIPNGRAFAKCFLIRANNKYTLNQRICSLTPKKDDSLFLHYILNRNPYFLKFNDGVNQTNLRKNEVLECKIPLPPLPEQQKIAEILSTVDQKINSIDSKIEETQTLKRGLMQRLLSEGIGHSEFKGSELSIVYPLRKIPKTWEIKTLSDITMQITDGAHFTPTYTSTGIPFLRVTDLKSKNLLDSAIKYIPKKEHDELIKRCKPEKGDILYSKNGTIGLTRFVTWDWEFSIFVSLCLIKPNCELINPIYLKHYLESNIVNDQIRIRSKQGTVTNLHLEEIREFFIPFPPLEEQKQIAEILSTTDEKLESLRAKKEAFETLKKGLMQKLLSGEVRV